MLGSTLTPDSNSELVCNNNVQLGYLSNADAKQFIDLAIRSQEFSSYQRWLTKEVGTVVKPNTSKANANLVGDTVLVNIPAKGGAGYSGFSIGFSNDRKFSIRGSASTTFIEAGQNIKGLLQTNGVTILNATISKAGQFISGVILKDNVYIDITSLDLQNIDLRGWLSCLNSCLSSLGVPAWLTSMLGVVCAVICAGSAGTGCVPCLYGVAAALGGQLGYCIGRCGIRSIDIPKINYHSSLRLE